MGFKDKVKKVKNNMRDTVEEAGRDIGRELSKVAEKIAPADNAHHPLPEPRQELPPQTESPPKPKEKEQHQWKQPNPEPQQKLEPEQPKSQPEQAPHPQDQPAEPETTTDPPPPILTLTGSISNFGDNLSSLPSVEAARPSVMDGTVDPLHSDSNKAILTAFCILLSLLLAFLLLKRNKKKSSRAPSAPSAPPAPTVLASHSSTSEKEGESAGTTSGVNAGAPAAARGGSPWTLVQPSADQFVANYTGGDNTSLDPHFVDEPEGAGAAFDPVAAD